MPLLWPNNQWPRDLFVVMMARALVAKGCQEGATCGHLFDETLRDWLEIMVPAGVA